MAGCHRHAPRPPAAPPAPIIIPAPIIVPVPVPARPRLLVFTATWCAPCRELHEVMNDPRIRKKLDGYSLETIDVDQHKDLVHQYKVSAFPTLIILSSRAATTRLNRTC